eukprot:TRINITY_DN1560_c2_g1_i1.p1 TRINITY_DN1560_c2_g1~~TRINITY_DN1560_c2_g1_i1.p1  ORF type:complete len:341 (-),score=93.17 TRINITY_DN1560_c2_g1_i1:84-1106(-)
MFGQASFSLNLGQLLSSHLNDFETLNEENETVVSSEITTTLSQQLNESEEQTNDTTSQISNNSNNISINFNENLNNSQNSSNSIFFSNSISSFFSNFNLSSNYLNLNKLEKKEMSIKKNYQCGPPCVIFQNPSNTLQIGFTEEFMEQLQSERIENNARDLRSFAEEDGETEHSLAVEAHEVQRRRKLLLMMIGLNISYCITIFFLSLSSNDSKKKKNKSALLFTYLILSFFSDLIGFLAIMQNIVFLLNIFIIMELGALICSLFTSLSSFVFFNMAILLISLQLRVALSRVQQTIDVITEIRNVINSVIQPNNNDNNNNSNDNNNNVIVNTSTNEHSHAQ